MEQYAIYLRKSRADQDAEARGEIDTLARHRAALLSLAKTQNRAVAQIYEEVVSGDSISARPEMQKLLNAVETGAFAGVLVMDIDRLARGDTIDQGIIARAFRLSGTLIVTPNKVYNQENESDEEFFEFGLFLSRREYKLITRRQQRGRKASIEEGKFVANKTPYGYQRVKLQGEKGWVLAPDPHTAPSLRTIFHWFTVGYEQPDGSFAQLGVSKIARRLNVLGIPTQTGASWTPATIRGMLENPTYAGWLRWGNRASVKRVENGTLTITRPRAPKDAILLARGRHPPLISQDMFDAAQALLKKPGTPRGPISRKLQNPLAGLVVCLSCGRTMIRRPYQNGSLSWLICPDPDCHTVGASLASVETALLESLRLWLHPFALAPCPRPAHRDTVAALDQAIQSKERQRAALNQQQDRACELVEQGVYPTDVFLERSSRLRAEIDALTQALFALHTERGRVNAARQSNFALAPRIRHLLDAYPLAESAQEKNDLLKSILEKVVYQKTVRTRWNPENDDLSLTILPKFVP